MSPIKRAKHTAPTSLGIRQVKMKIELSQEYLEELKNKKRREALNGKEPVWKEYLRLR